MDTSSEFSSGCASGWTSYFYQASSCFTEPYACVTTLEDDEEDSSLASDASSGPPHLRDQSAEEARGYGGGGKKKGTESLSRCTADTATSQVSRFPQKRPSYCGSQEGARFQAESETRNLKHKGLSKSHGVKSGGSLRRKKK